MGGGRAWGRSIATGLGRKPVGGYNSAEIRRPVIRSTAHEPIGGGRGTEMEGVVDRECHWKGPEGPGSDEGGRGEEEVGGIG